MVWSLSMALRMVNSLRMQATMATFLGLPAAIKRLWKTLIAGLCFIATTAAIYTTARTSARPPQMRRLPVRGPESLASGATPTSLAI